MATKSSIEWTESTWNPITGCTKISPGCANCYAERIAKRLPVMGQPNYTNGFKVTTHNHTVDMPLRWKRSQTIFVNSMSDLFHEQVPETYILRIFKVMNRLPGIGFKSLPNARNAWRKYPQNCPGLQTSGWELLLKMTTINIVSMICAIHRLI